MFTTSLKRRKDRRCIAGPNDKGQAMILRQKWAGGRFDRRTHGPPDKGAVMLIDRGTVAREAIQAASVDIDPASTSNLIGGSDDLRPLSKAAIDAARTLKSHAMSPVILAGLVRLFEWLVIAGTGLALYAWYLGSQFGFSVLYASMIVGIPTVAVAVFQVFGLYHALWHALNRASGTADRWRLDLAVRADAGVCVLFQRWR